MSSLWLLLGAVLLWRAPGASLCGVGLGHVSRPAVTGLGVGSAGTLADCPVGSVSWSRAMCCGLPLYLQLGRAGWAPFPAEEREGSTEVIVPLIEEGAAVEKLSQ